MRVIRSRIGLGGLVAVVLAGCGVVAVLASSSAAGAKSPPARPAAVLPARLGYVASVSASVQRPIGKRLVIKPDATYVVARPELARVLRALALRRLGTWHPRMTVTFRVRIGSVPKRGNGRTLVVRSRTLTAQSLIASRQGSGRMVRFRLGRFVLSPALTARIKQAATKSGKLRISSSVGFKLRFTARGRTVTLAGTPWSFSWVQSFRERRFGGANLHQLDVGLRRVIGLVQRAPMACQTRNTLVRRLRITDSVLRSGQRSAAAGLLGVWIANASSMRAGGVLSAQQQGMLRERLGAIQRRVGTGWPAKLTRTPRWPALPKCGGARAAAGYQPFDAGDAQTVFVALVSAFPYVGKFLGPLLAILWPSSNDTETIVQEAIAQNVYDRVNTQLTGLHDGVQDFLTNESKLGTADWTPARVLNNWEDYRSAFILDRAAFVVKDTELTSDFKKYQDLAWRLLPLFAQYEDLWLSFVREGVLAGFNWGMSPSGVKDLYDSYFIGTDAGIDQANAYIAKIYQNQLAKVDKVSLPVTFPVSGDTAYTLFRSPSYGTGEGKPHTDDLDFQLKVGDYQAMWPALDPTAYPFGVPNFKETRMIDSYLSGSVLRGALAPPANPNYPLSFIEVYLKQVGSEVPNINAIKNGNGGSGFLTGDTISTELTAFNVTSDTYSWSVGPSTYLGPIIAAATQDTGSGPAIIHFEFANGWKTSFGFKNYDLADWSPANVAWPDESLQVVKIMNTYRPQPTFYPKQYYSDALMFGFRFTDSYYPSGEVRQAGTYKDLDVRSWSSGSPAVIYFYNDAFSWSHGWTYNSYTHTLSQTAPGNAGTFCLQARGGGTTAGTPVEIYQSSQRDAFGQVIDCAETTFNPTAAQQWTLSTDGTIMNQGRTVNHQNGSITTVGSKLCLQPNNGSTTDGTGLVLWPCDGSSAQRWTTPWTTRLPGPVRAPNTQACLDAPLPPALEARGAITAVELQTCNGSSQQNWYYDDKPATDGTPATFALKVHGGTKCLVGGASTLNVKIADCNRTDATQEWTLPSDGTIRVKVLPAGSQPLCLTKPTGAPTPGTKIQLIPCVAGNPDQQWIWPTG